MCVERPLEPSAPKDSSLLSLLKLGLKEEPDELETSWARMGLGLFGNLGELSFAAILVLSTSFISSLGEYFGGGMAGNDDKNVILNIGGTESNLIPA